MENVFPTPVGVFPVEDESMNLPASLPHARGGVSRCQKYHSVGSRSSPRPWGCFCNAFGRGDYTGVFPTPVGVFLVQETETKTESRLPHARGGVSMMVTAESATSPSSPRPWGCFCSVKPTKATVAVFPTPVGVFPYASFSKGYFPRLPHARGGVSFSRTIISPATRSSPRPWGCFRCHHRESFIKRVFPTPVGVFPRGLSASALSRCLPHARGGVSHIELAVRKLV